MVTDVLVIGAGPAGLAAAFETASKGLQVTIVDESTMLGGQLRQQTQHISSLPSSYQSMRGFELAHTLEEQLKPYSIRYLLGHRMIGIYKDGSVGVTDEENVFPVKSKTIIVATGAAEKGIAFPKWTLPGIMTIGAAQTLINRDMVVPGRDAVIVGSSDFSLDVARQLLDLGVNIIAIVESNKDVTARDMGKIIHVKEQGIPLYLNSSIKEARGIGEVQEVEIQLPDRMLTENVDFVCLDGGRSPILDAFYQIGCSFGYQEELGGWLPQYNRSLQTDHQGVYLAGNAAGISTQGAILATGMIAGISVCEELNLLSKNAAERERASLWNELDILESKLYPDTWNARNNHIENFSAPLLKDQFIT
ncbi:NAD(P)/FAD-dependent oxidoreductase [Bacillus salipaludis]|uniref:NAD(P)/FAD-dependent oxidoreductase n=1 Tax=Bacillus salipaludis TaxID=2547811 RepID=A0ABW8RC72_9BACI